MHHLKSNNETKIIPMMLAANHLTHHDSSSSTAAISRLIPGPFVILQGANGDGMSNSLEVLPEELFHVTENENGRGRRSSLIGRRRGSLKSVVEELDDEKSVSMSNTKSDSESSNSSNKENVTVSTPYRDDNTEGGLHLPLGSSSPIMRKIHHQAACSLNSSIPSIPFMDDKDSFSSSLPNRTSSLKETRATNNRQSSKAAAASKHSGKESRAIQQWQNACREKEIHAYDESRQNIRAVVMQRRKQHSANLKSTNGGSCSRPPSSKEADEKSIQQLDQVDEMMELTSQHRTWYQRDGRLVVIESVPHMSLQGVVTHPVLMEGDGDEEQQQQLIATLSPGSEIYATELIVLDSRTLRQVYPPLDNGTDLKHIGANTSTTIQLLKINSPYNGYIVSHLHDYPYVAPGSPLDYVPTYKASNLNTSSSDDQSTIWIWRVVYQPDGAFVRNGSELMSDQISTLPYGSFCNVRGKIINDMGLSRLKIQALVRQPSCIAQKEKEEEEGQDEFNQKEKSEWKEIEGWTSLFINPLSGNSGRIIEPVNFPVPVIYRVVHENGAVVNTGIEISSSEVGLAPKGTLLSIDGRAFSDHPRSCCIERLRLAGGCGWISSRLSESQSDHSQMMIELVGIDDSFDPDNPAGFHFEIREKVMSQLQTISNTSIKVKHQRQLSEINDDSGSDQEQTSSNNMLERSKYSAIVTSTNLFKNGLPSLDHAHPNRCLICLSEERTATIVHGETGHIACCLICARVLKARGDSCPVCREPIDTVIQHFWA